MKVIAKKINNPNCDYLTEGKSYNFMYTRTGFIYINDDNFRMITTRIKNCPHIKGNWTIITDKAKVR